MIGKIINELRRKRGISLSELAERANISKSYLSNIERNLHQNPSIHVIKKLALVLHVDLRELIVSEIQSDSSDNSDQKWIEFVDELKRTGIEKENLHEYKTLIEFIKWKNQQVEAEKIDKV